MEEKPCLNCGEPVGPGRSDKKYCSESCRTEYNNQQKERKQHLAQAIALPKYIQDINAILQENHRIMAECLGGNDNTRMRIRDLHGRKFNFKFFTSQRVNDGNQEVYNFCYNLGYKLAKDDQWVVIVRNDREVQLSGSAYRLQITENDGLC